MGIENDAVTIVIFTLKISLEQQTKDMYSYSQPSIKRKHDIVILHIGTNDLVTRKSEVEISQGIIDLAEHIKSHDIEVAVSGIIARGKNI